MAVTQISICNNALVKVGADRISSISQDTRSAILLNAIWDQVRDEVLRAHPWNFAMKRAVLAPNSDAPDFGYDYAYDLPSDCLRVWSAKESDEESASEINHSIEDSQILCDYDAIYVRYIYRNEDPSAWDSLFASAMSCRLAQEISYALTQSLPLRDSLKQEYKLSLQDARTADGMEGTIDGLNADTWTLSRR